jgi:hypothetical protein
MNKTDASMHLLCNQSITITITKRLLNLSTSINKTPHHHHHHPHHTL